MERVRLNRKPNLSYITLAIARVCVRMPDTADARRGAIARRTGAAREGASLQAWGHVGVFMLCYWHRE